MNLCDWKIQWGSIGDQKKRFRFQLIAFVQLIGSCGNDSLPNIHDYSWEANQSMDDVELEIPVSCVAINMRGGSCSWTTSSCQTVFGMKKMSIDLFDVVDHLHILTVVNICLIYG